MSSSNSEIHKIALQVNKIQKRLDNLSQEIDNLSQEIDNLSQEFDNSNNLYCNKKSNKCFYIIPQEKSIEEFSWGSFMSSVASVGKQAGLTVANTPNCPDFGTNCSETLGTSSVAQAEHLKKVY